MSKFLTQLGVIFGCMSSSAQNSDSSFNSHMCIYHIALFVYTFVSKVPATKDANVSGVTPPEIPEPCLHWCICPALFLGILAGFTTTNEIYIYHIDSIFAD